MQMILYHAVMRARGTARRAVLEVRWGEASPHGIHEFCNSVISVAHIVGEAGPLDLEIILTGEEKESLAHQLTGRLARLAEQGIAVRVR
jgi:hypothetical protein